MAQYNSKGKPAQQRKTNHLRARRRSMDRPRPDPVAGDSLASDRKPQ